MKKLIFNIFLYLIFFFLFIFSLFYLDKDFLFKINLLKFPEKEKQEIINTIKIYNKILMDFYATGGNPALIDDMPSSKFLKHEIFKEIGHFSYLGFVQVLDLSEFKVKKMDFENLKEARITIEEIWNFQRQDLISRKPLSEIYSIKFEAVYKLKKIKNQWFLEEWEPLKF